MAIPVTTRAGKGSPLTNTEMDTNLIQVARSATTSQEGNVELATVAEAMAGSSGTLAVTPQGLAAAVAAAGGGASQQLGPNSGSVTFSNGFTIKYGNDVSAGSPKVVNFANAFPNVCCSVQITRKHTRVWSYGNEIYAYNYTRNGFTFEISGNKGEYQPGYNVSWIACGY